MLRCFGLDAAWSDRNPSAICVLDASGTVLDEAELRTDAEIVEWILSHLQGPSVVAADLPLRVTATSGMRPCDREVMRAYGARGAGPHPTNRSLLIGRDGRIRGEQLAAALAAHGFGDPWDGGWRTLIEAFPHPGLVEVFALPRRLAYKKGGVEHRRAGLSMLTDLLDSLGRRDPPLLGSELPDPRTLRGRALKALEDRLDARFCAWTALLWARHGPERVRLFGDSEHGHIAVALG